MIWVVLTLSVMTVSACVWAAVFRRRAMHLSNQVRRLLPFAIASGADPSVIAQAVPFFGWVIVMTGGDTTPGTIGRIGWCPCQNDYTCATNQIVLNAAPANAAAVAPLLNYPPPDPIGLPCASDCVPVMTHRWRGWDVVVNQNTGQIKLNCYQFAQYHCKKPDDPDRNKPPYDGSPGPEL
jgi:hypothetical protein